MPSETSRDNDSDVSIPVDIRVGKKAWQKLQNDLTKREAEYKHSLAKSRYLNALLRIIYIIAPGVRLADVDFAAFDTVVASLTRAPQTLFLHVLEKNPLNFKSALLQFFQSIVSADPKTIAENFGEKELLEFRSEFRKAEGKIERAIKIRDVLDSAEVKIQELSKESQLRRMDGK
jgi:hypothetical protein